MGFADEREMLTCLLIDQSTSAIGDLLGYESSNVRYRMDKLGIPQRPRGGRNNRKKNGNGEELG